MKNLLFLTLFSLSTLLYAKSYETELKKFFHKTENLLELTEKEKVLNLSSSLDPIDGYYNAGIALLPDSPVKVLRDFIDRLNPGSKALIIFYPSDEGFHKITKANAPDLSLTLQNFKDIASVLGFEILHSELKRHFAYFKTKQSLCKFASKYLKAEIEKERLEKIFTSEDVKIPTKLAVVLVKKPNQNARPER